MANTGLQAPALPACPPPHALQQCAQQVQQIGHIFSQNSEAHLLRTNDWMNIHQFQGVKVQRFCLTLV